MSVERNLPIMRERKQAILAGDPERVAEQRKLNKLTARERINRLFDDASFVELDAFMGRGNDSGVITGFGLIDGRPAYAYAQDYTVIGGAVGEEQARKVIKVMDLAAKSGAPVIAMFDSMGARLKEGVDAVNAYANISAKTAALSGVVPQIAVVMGQCAASAAMIAVMSDVVIVAESGRMFMNGPQVVSANTSDKVDAKQLGGAEACVKSGLAHLAAGSDEEAIALARQTALMLPSNNLEDAPVELTQPDDVNRLIPSFDGMDTVSDARGIIAQIADNGQFLELGAAYAPEMLTLLCAIGGRTVGVVATQPSVDGGAMTGAGCSKAARFVRMLDSFNVSVLTLVDTIGVSVANASGQSWLVRATAQLNAALAEATCARVALVTGNAIAAGYMALASRAVADMVYAWPGSVIAPLATPAAVQVLMREQLKGALNAQEKRAELEKQYAQDVADGLNAARQGYVDDVIEPSQTRMMLAQALEMLSSKRDQRLPKKHGNMPL